MSVAVANVQFLSGVKIVDLTQFESGPFGTDVWPGLARCRRGEDREPQNGQHRLSPAPRLPPNREPVSHVLNGPKDRGEVMGTARKRFP